MVHRKTNNSDDGEYDSNADLIANYCNYEHHTRRNILSILSSTSILFGAANKPALAQDINEFDKPMNSLTRQVRTSVVRGAQLIDKVDGKWERFSDDLGLGSERNQPKRNVIDAGGNERSKKVVTSDFKNQNIQLDEEFAFAMLQECDEVSVMLFNVCCLCSSLQNSTSLMDLLHINNMGHRTMYRHFFRA